MDKTIEFLKKLSNLMKEYKVNLKYDIWFENILFTIDYEEINFDEYEFDIDFKSIENKLMKIRSLK